MPQTLPQAKTATPYRHEPASEGAPLAAPPHPEQHRVTPEEFAQAVSRIEARREEERQRERETVAVGDAVETLGLSVTADEVLAEVASMRGQAAAGQARKPRRARLGRTVLALSLLGNVALAGLLLRGGAPRTDAATTVPAAGERYRPLPAVPAGTSFFVDGDTVLQMANADDPVLREELAKAVVDTRPTAQAQLWEVRKQEGGYVVRVWSDEADALRLRNGRQSVHVFQESIDGSSVVADTWVPATRLGPTGDGSTVVLRVSPTP